MQAYRTSVKIKLGLIVAAIVIAAASLFYTNRLADRVTAQEQEAVRLWVQAIEYQAQTTVANPHLADFEALPQALDQANAAGLLPDTLAKRFGDAIAWARTMPPTEELDFVFNEIVQPARFNVPAIITDAEMQTVVADRNVVDEGTLVLDTARVLQLAAKFDEINEPIEFVYYGGEVQYVHYGESELARLIRWFPPIQLGFVALFILVGYLGFSYVRRSEQSNLWVGMAKEAAHQLGTPLSSMIGWIELLRLQHEGDAEAETVAAELERDVERLRRVADRFEKIGSVPELRPTRLAPVLETVADYMRRRLPREGPRVSLDLYIPPDLAADLNPDLFEWVIENLLKNALDAIEGNGQIIVEATREGKEARIEVRDTGKGIERAAQRHIFRPGFSTKKRGWGLGLSLAKRIVEQYHGGSLALAESRPGAGAIFVITLRAATPLPAPPTPTAEPHSATA
ncbi:MAG: HAMP domain-containing histidine kinase [Rhodothermaceae bacterium]|nr:HAMP domain-containing histidine kinase [Rhodothermaceae bacterium]